MKNFVNRTEELLLYPEMIGILLKGILLHRLYLLAQLQWRRTLLLYFYIRQVKFRTERSRSMVYRTSE